MRIEAQLIKQPVAMSQQEEKSESDIAESYRQFIIDLLWEVNSVKALRFIYSYLQVHIRKRKKLKNIVQSQYQKKGHTD